MTVETLFGPVLTAKKAKPLRLKVIKPIFQRLKVSEAASEYFSDDLVLNSAEKVSTLFDFLRRESKEHFWAVHLGTRNNIVCLDPVSVGSLNASIVHPREVYKSALLSSAGAILFVHNHPSGQIEPSAEDREITARLKQAGDLLGIRVLDHVIIGEGYYSFADRGLL